MRDGQGIQQQALVFRLTATSDIVLLARLIHKDAGSQPRACWPAGGLKDRADFDFSVHIPIPLEFLVFQRHTASPQSGEHPIQFDVEPLKTRLLAGRCRARSASCLVRFCPQRRDLLIFPLVQSFSQRLHQVEGLARRHLQREQPTERFRGFFQRQGRTQITHGLLHSRTRSLTLESPEEISRRFSMRTAILLARVSLAARCFLFHATAVVGTLEADLAHEGQHLFGTVSLQLLGMSAGSSPLSRSAFVCCSFTENALHPPASHRKHRGHHRHVPVP
jgi:hypothetical protein